MIQQPVISATAPAVARLNPLALAAGFGVAGVVLILVFGAVMGSLWGMMGGNGIVGGNGTMGGYGMMGGRGMMGGGGGFFVYALLCGFIGGAIAGGVAAWVYNGVIARKPRAV